MSQHELRQSTDFTVWMFEAVHAAIADETALLDREDEVSRRLAGSLTRIAARLRARLDEVHS